MARKYLNSLQGQEVCLYGDNFNIHGTLYLLIGYENDWMVAKDTNFIEFKEKDVDMEKSSDGLIRLEK